MLGGPRPARVPRAGLPDGVSVPRAGEARGPSCSPPALVPVPRARPSRSLSIRTVNPLETLSRWPPHASRLPGPSAQPVGVACTALATSPAPRPGPGSQHATERAWSQSPMSTSSPGPAPVLGLSPPAPPAGGPSRAGRLCLPEHALPAAPRPLPPPAPLRPSGAPFFLLLHWLLSLHSPSSPQRPSGFGLRCHAAYARACGLSSRPLRDRVGGRAQDARAWPAHSGPNASPEPNCSSRPLPGWAPCRGPAVTLPSTVPGGV